MSVKLKSLLYLLNFQFIISNSFVGGAKIYRIERERSKRTVHFLHQLHMPQWLKETPSSTVNGTEMPDPATTPDYRIPEPPYLATTYKDTYMYYEFERPLRISPNFKATTYRWGKFNVPWFHSYNVELPYNLGCYCTTVYRKFIMLAGCAVLTKRHILTTASSTDLILNHWKGRKRFDDILGAWYDTDLDTWNSSMYIGPARIHYHPRYMRAHTVNISHPIPCQFDLSLWTTTHNLDGYAVKCVRGSSGRWQYSVSTPHLPDIAIIVGFQFMKAYRKVPMPWFKYAVRTRKYIVPCPKTEWGWFHCIQGNWAKFGLDSGAAWHRALNSNWLWDGLIGMATFSMRLRSEEITHYFTVINCHSVLDFIYDSYMGQLPVEFIDYRFEDTKWRVPQVYQGMEWSVNTDNKRGEERFYGHEMAWYKKKK